MREIKFRAWDKIGKEMFTPIRLSFPYGENRIIVSGIGGMELLGGGSTDTENDDCVLMQFTGLKDKNGLDNIYEGDLIGLDGVKKGNIYETSTSQIYESGKIFKQGIACIVENMGTKEWRNSEQKLLELGCKYA